MNRIVFERAYPATEIKQYPPDDNGQLLMHYNDGEVYAEIDWRNAGQALPAGAVPLLLMQYIPYAGEGDPEWYRPVEISAAQYFGMGEVIDAAMSRFATEPPPAIVSNL